MFGRKFVKVAMAPAPMSLFDLLKFLALLVSKIGSNLTMRFSDGLMNTSGGLLPNLSELLRCVVDDRRNFGDLFRRQVEFGAEPFLHARADLLRPMKSKEQMPGI